jgi:hypothetical protein
MHIHLHLDTHIHLHFYTHTHTHSYTHLHLHTSTHPYTHTHTHTYQHIPAHTYAQAKSAQIRLWRETETRLREATQEANENVKHLTTLNKHFEDIFSGTPQAIAEALPNLLSKVKMVRLMSKYLQNTKNMTGILVKITNRLITECKRYICRDGSLWKQESTALIAKFRACMQLNHEYQSQYRITKHERVGGGVRELPFMFDESQIFAKFEHFSSRLEKLIEIFSVHQVVQNLCGLSSNDIIVVSNNKISNRDTASPAKTNNPGSSRLGSTTDLFADADAGLNSSGPIPRGRMSINALSSARPGTPADLFGDVGLSSSTSDMRNRLHSSSHLHSTHASGSVSQNKAQGMLGLNDVCEPYWKAVEMIKKRPYDLLDYTCTVFNTDYEYMCLVTNALESDLQDFIHTMFTHIEGTDQALDLLSRFETLMQRDNLRAYLSTKYIDIFANFSSDLDSVAHMYETQKHEPPIARYAPPVAGRISWVRHMLKLIEVPMHKFRNHAALMLSKESKAIIKKYNKIARTFVEYEMMWERTWVNLIDEARQGLNATLLVRHPETNMLHVNFDHAVLQLLREARYMRELEIAIPPSAQSVQDREQEIKVHIQKLKFMLKEYEGLLRLLVPDLKLLYAPYLSELESLLRPALTMLTWTSTSVEGYITQFMSSLESIHDMCKKVKDTWDNRIQRNLKVISRVQLVSMPDKVVATELFVSEQESIIRVRSTVIDQQSLAIGTAINDIVQMMLALPAENTNKTLHSNDIAQTVDKLWELVYQVRYPYVKHTFV